MAELWKDTNNNISSCQVPWNWRLFSWWLTILAKLCEKHWTYNVPRRRNHHIWEKHQCAWIHESKGTKCFWGVAVVAPIGGFRFLDYQSRAGVFGSRKEKRWSADGAHSSFSTTFPEAPVLILLCSSDAFTPEAKHGHANSVHHLGFFLTSDILSSSQVNISGLKIFQHRKGCGGSFWIIAQQFICMHTYQWLIFQMAMIDSHSSSL